jgi:hypothetical protein
MSIKEKSDKYGEGEENVWFAVKKFFEENLKK